MTIAERVVKNGSASIEELVELTGVSAMTVYRDIEALEEAGVLLRHRGQVTAVATGLNEIAASIRVNQNAELKQQVARVVARRIRPGSSIMVDDSTTALWVLRMLEVVPITVVTNSMLVARELERRSGVRLFVTGGEYQSWAEAMIGQTTTDVIRGIRADYALMSASGISDLQCFHPYEDLRPGEADDDGGDGRIDPADGPHQAQPAGPAHVCHDDRLRPGRPRLRDPRPRDRRTAGSRREDRQGTRLNPRVYPHIRCYKPLLDW